MPASSSARPSRVALALVVLLAAVLPAVVALPSIAAGAAAPDHLVISEVVTGGASASDEIVELYNPTDAALPLEGLELVYVSASGATVTRRASWAAGAATLPAHRHLLLANDLGAFAPIADVLVTGGMAATGGSVALRVQGATTAIDAVGWGSAAGTWLEGAPAPAPGAGESLERLPGGALGSTIDTDDNGSDFVVRLLPDPQNLGSPPVPDPATSPAPSVAPTPSLGPTPAPSVEPTPLSSPTPEPATPAPTPTSSPGPLAVPIATARALPDGMRVTVEGVALTGHDFTDGGGYVADASGAIAVIASGDIILRGHLVRVSGEIDDRFSQRTIRAGAGEIVDRGPGVEPSPVTVATGAVDEAVEGQLVRISAAVTSSASVLTTGTAFDVDDGTGPTRLVVAATSGIDVSGWRSGFQVDLVGVVGQRDSTGAGTTGYRVQPRDPADVVSVQAPASPSPEPSTPGSTAAPTASASPAAGVLSIAEARAAARNTRVVVRGAVTMPTGIVDGQTAAIQDGTGAILLRLGEEAGTLALGETIQVAGTRSTKSGMETLRVTEPPGRRLDPGAEPGPVTVRTGDAGESFEAQLVIVRGGLVASARRASSGTVTFDIDDGSGPLRIVVGSVIGLDREAFGAGAWVEVIGVLGQETTGAQPDRGYRVWPRTASDLRLLASPTAAGEAGGDGDAGAGTGGGTGGSPGLDAIDDAAAQGVAVGATLVVGAWPELGIGGLLWDGDRLAAVSAGDGARVEALLRSRRPPIALELRGMTGAGTDERLGLSLVALGTDVDGVLLASGRPVAPATLLPPAGSPARWIAVVGRLAGNSAALRVETSSGAIALEPRCDAGARLPRGVVSVLGVAAPGRPVLVPCGGIQPAPAVARPAGDRSSTLDGARDGSAVQATAVSGPTAQPSLVAAALLGAGAVALTAAAVWVRLREPRDPHDDGVPAPAEEPAAEGAAALTPPPPILTLVRLPRERGP